ncbi:unnamed protein product [Acanthoscelides obtectus]|uniref:BED-type domain-containing protein n=1 Tax=Acanthoscelides obtectus TaxID=200917 RepID=A0A9P0MJN8_ACAOB|nr:unnamed protein product [Acanthoscelides obtectus]CAK1666967.1 hypothetical protein AOBTE_LOCUS25581 [Acanthoscelides obtectus]
MESSASGSGESQTQKRSVIWMHFTNISEANAKSNLCKNIYSHKNGNISNLRKHLKTKHPTLSLEGERAKRRVEDENMTRCKKNFVSASDVIANKSFWFRNYLLRVFCVIVTRVNGLSFLTEYELISLRMIFFRYY